jgi:7-carboxy-7-deazaguanine synthase
MRKILVSEIFGPVVQGEGALIGRPTLFVRTGGCDYRCQWCDTLYAVLPEHREEWTPMSAPEILAQIEPLSGGKPMLVTVSGGNPALQPLLPLLELGHARGYSFALETQGSVARAWFSQLDHLVLSPKPPSSGMATKWPRLAECVRMARAGETPPHISLKIVVFDEADYEFARQVGARHPDIPLYLQVGNPAPNTDEDAGASALLERLRWLSERALSDGWHNVTVLPQLHILIYGNRRGV